MKIPYSVQLCLSALAVASSYAATTVDVSGNYTYDDVHGDYSDDVTFQVNGDFSYNDPFRNDVSTKRGVFSAKGLHFEGTPQGEGSNFPNMNFFCSSLETGSRNYGACFVYTMRGSKGSGFVPAQVSFENLGDISMVATNLDMAGIADYGVLNFFGSFGSVTTLNGDTVSFNNVGNIKMQGLQWGGIAFGKLNELTFRNTGDISFENTNFSAPAGAIYINGGGDSYYYDVTKPGNVYFESTGNITFRNLNRATEDIPFFSRYITSAGIFTNGGSVHFSNTGNILFENNYSATGTGAINAGVWEDTNELQGVTFSHINGSIIFRNNSSGSADSAAYAGAISLRGEFQILQAGDVLFENNWTTEPTGAGAIDSSASRFNGEWLLSADNGNIVFRGNKAGDVLRAIRITGRSTMPILFRAQTGREVTFYDGITIGKSSTSASMTTLSINKALVDGTDYGDVIPEFGGVVRFTGEQTKDLLAQGENETDIDYQERVESSRLFDLAANVNVEGGSLVLEHGVTVDNADVGSILGMEIELNNQFSVNAGTLEMTSGASINGRTVQLGGHGASCLRIGATPSNGYDPSASYDLPSITAKTLDMSKGFDWDLMPFAERGDSGLNVSVSGSLTMGGTIGIVDSLDDYAAATWGQDREFTIFNLQDTETAEVREGEFEQLISNTTQSPEVDSPYSYKGTWSYEWRDTDEDGIDDQLVAVWKHKEVHEPTDPTDPTDPSEPTNPDDPSKPSLVPGDRVGYLTLNSLWSSASNAISLGNAALSNLSYVRLKNKYGSNAWAMGLGDFARRHSREGVDGYDYDGGGYAVGFDSDFHGNSGVWGIAFGQMFGYNKSRDYNARITQKTMMGTLYWGKIFNEKEDSWWTAKADTTWAFTDNCMRSNFDNGMNAHGDWNNRTWLVQAEVSRTTRLRNQWTISPYVRLEFTHGSEDGFTEDGTYARQFGEAMSRRLSIPVGIGFGKETLLYGKPWQYSLRLSYVGDVIQDIPHAGVYSFYSDINWIARAVKPSRHAFRLEYDTAVQLNDRWNVYAGYTLENRDRAIWHQCNLGVSYSF